MKRVLPVHPGKQTKAGEPLQKAKLKVCAYCRVSSASNEQMASYEAQVAYYTSYIQQKPEWEFAGVYADGGVSGTRKDGRADFNRMLRDAEAGRIGLIITKSISRFARNTADCLEVVRLLKDRGVAVFFERENINTLSAESELLLSVLSSIAQEESRSISQNLRWAYQRKFRQGKVAVTTRRFLGYDLGENGELVINEQEAEIVRRIFREYLAGKGMRNIAAGLDADRIKTVTGLDRWPENTIRNILTNEKYCGDAVLQKTYIADYLTHRKKKNGGELPKFWVSGNHQPIVTKEDFESVQRLMAERAAEFGNFPGDRNKYAGQYAFSGKLVCGNCGAPFKRRTWNSKERSKQIVWQCSTYVKQGREACPIKAVDDVTLKTVFVRLFNRLYKNQKPMLGRFMANVEKALRSGGINEQRRIVENEIFKTTSLIKELIRKQIKESGEPQDFQNEYDKLQARLAELRSRQGNFEGDDGKLDEVARRTQEIADFLEAQNMVKDFDEDLFGALVEQVKVLSPTRLLFELKNGLVIEQKFIKRKGIHGLQ